MRMWKSMVLALGALVVASHANAATIYLDGSSSSTNSSFIDTGDYTAGTEFTVGSGDSITFNALGVLDLNADGLSGPRQVGLWTSAGSLLTSTTVTSGQNTINSAISGAIWHYTTVPSTVLTAGTYRIAAIAGTGGDWDAVGGRIGDGVTIAGGYRRNTPGDGFGFPGLSFTSPLLSSTLIQTDLAPVPLPGSGLLLMAGLGALGARRLKSARTVSECN